MKKYLIALLFFCLFLMPFLVLATPGDSTTVPAGPGDSAPIPCGTNQACIDNPIKVYSPQALIGQIIDVVLGIVGSLALVMFVFGGITWMTSSGSPEKIKKGRDILIWAAIGLVIIFSSYALVNFVIKGIAHPG
ncbi:MAG: pilin [Candidatus Falkowbacteria bacterium]|nr:pilin [Candidatus Falkowbacteria bacterium]